MGFVQLKYRFRHAIKPIFYFFVVIFLIGGAFSFSSYQSHRATSGIGGPKRRVPRLVAVVNGQEIPRDSLDNYLAQISHQGAGVPVDMHRMALTQWLDSTINSILMEQAERKEKIRVSHKELEDKRMQAVDEILAPQIQERVHLAKILEKEQLTLDAYRQKLAHDRFSDLEVFRSQLAQEKLQKKIEDQVKPPTDEELKNSFMEAKARHILLSPKDMKRKAEAKLDQEKVGLQAQLDDAKKANKTPDPAVKQRLDAIEGERQALNRRNFDDEAKKKAEELRQSLLKGADFAKLAQENSDDPGSGAKGGDLGSVRRGQTVPEFDQVAFTIPLGQISQVVKTRFGYHLLRVDQRELKLPKDFDKNKDMLRTQYVQEQKSRAWGEYQNKLKDNAKIEVRDPELQAYRMLDEGGDEQKAIQLLDLAVQQDSQNAGAMYELAQLWRGKGNEAEALKLLQRAEKVPGAERSAELMYTLGQLLQAKNDSVQAIAYYKKASDLTAPVEEQNMPMHQRLQAAYNTLKQPDLAKQETDWLDRMKKAQAEQGGPGGMMQMPGGTFNVPPQ